MLVSGGISTAFAVNRALAVFGSYTRFDGLITLLTYAIIGVFAVQALATRARAERLVAWLLAGGAIAGAWATTTAIVASVQGVAMTAGESAFSFGGLVRADGTMGNANLLGIYLAMLLPLAVRAIRRAERTAHRVLAIDCTVAMAIALVLTFSRSCWVAAALGVAIALEPHRLRRRRLAIGAAVLACCVVGVLVAGRVSSGGLSLTSSATTRALAIADIGGGAGGTRLHLWHDSLGIVGDHPLTGGGPDTAGLTLPAHQTGDWTPGVINDEVHNELLGVAATRGLFGVAAYLLLLVWLGRLWWRGRSTTSGAAAILGSWIAYQAALQLNFSWLPMTVMWWLVLAATVRLLDTHDAAPSSARASPPHRATAAVMIAAAIAVIAVAGVHAQRLAAADLSYAQSLDAQASTDIAAAKHSIDNARALASYESEYAAQAGDLAYDAHVSRQVDAIARSEYTDAVRLGTLYPYVYRRLALLADEFGDRTAAVATARQAVSLAPFDPASRKLLTDLGIN